MSLKIEITGVGEVMRKLGSFQGTRVLVKPMEQAVELVRADIATYPLPRLESAYRRTGTLGRRWTKTVRIHGDGVTGTVGNRTSYAPWVQSSKFQARIHRGRWRTDAMVIERQRRQIVAVFRNAIDRALGRR